MHYAVAGTGYTGTRVIKLFGNAIGISRRLPEELAAGDGEHTFLMCNLDQDEIAPVEIAGPWSLLYTIPPSPKKDQDARLPRLLGALATAPARIVYLSTIGVYGDRGGALVDESTLPAPAQPRTRRRFEAERLIINYASNTGCQAVILRVPGIYGPGRLGMQRIRVGGKVINESETQPGNRIHVDDLARCCVAALDANTPAGIYNVGDGDHRSGTWFANKTAELAGYPPLPQISREEAQSEFSKRRLSFVSEPRRVDTRKMREVLGVTPLYADPEDGIRASLEADGLLVRSGTD